MHFTVVFDSDESCDASFGLVFTPCAAWVQGRNEISVPHRERPKYERGDLREFTATQCFKSLEPFETDRVVIIVHGTGHGTEDDLKKLKDDLAEAAYEVIEIRG